MHKPLRIIKDDARVRLSQQVNLTSALRAALLTLPDSFTERQLFERIAAISYDGDPRMFLPAENRSKVANIVSKQAPQFRELYRRLAGGLPGVQWPVSERAEADGTVSQDMSARVRATHIGKLPATLKSRLEQAYARRSGIPPKEADESAFWLKIAGAPDLEQVLRSGTLCLSYYFGLSLSLSRFHEFAADVCRNVWLLQR